MKTRLAATIGPAAALAVYQELLEHTQRITAKLAEVHKTVWLAEPATTATAPYAWPGFEQAEQPPGDLGQRMQTAFARAFSQAAAAVVIIGTDCPGLTTEHLSAAFQALTTHDVVIGPATDGGYYLLGMRQLYADLFQNKSWSTDAVCSATLADAARLQLQVAQLPILRDVDTADDLAAWRAAER